MVTFTPIKAYGITWGRWKKDCTAGISDIADTPPPKIIDKKITLSSSSTLLKTVSTLLDFLPNTETTKILKRIKNKLPKGSFTGTIYIGPFATANPCLESTPPMRLIWAGVVFHAKGTFHINGAGQQSTGSFEIFENLAGSMQEACLCKTKKIAYRTIQESLNIAHSKHKQIATTADPILSGLNQNINISNDLLNKTSIFEDC